MALERHLILQELVLRPSGEWTPSAPGWTVVRVAGGIGYWLQGGGAIGLNPGDGFVANEASRLVLRASQLGPLQLELFCVQPQFLNGLLTVAEGHQLQGAANNPAAQAVAFKADDAVGKKFLHLIAQPHREGLAMRSALLQLWSQAVTGMLHLPLATDHGQTLRERFRHLVAQMPDAELATRPLPELAGKLHCSERHFSRLFREEFGVPLRARQTELRLLRARQLLADGSAKIINVAYESGYRHLGLFNAMFKKRFGVTPSEWRQQNLVPPPKNYPRRPGMALLLMLLAWVFLAPLARAQMADTPEQAQARAALAQKLSELRGPPPSARANAPLPAIPLAAAALSSAKAKKNLSTNAGPAFTVDKYLVSGNSVLRPTELGNALTNAPDAFGTNVTFAELRSALGVLQMAYRERGFVTVSVGLPAGQKLSSTNTTVKVQVTEGRLSAINVKGNGWFSTGNVLRALPSLHTNMLLNSHVFQRELDNANASRDRQIYPKIGPGPDPGTSALELKVVDTLPLHARVEINDLQTPGTPQSRLAFNAQYDNLWQLEHQVGVNYSFSELDYKSLDNYSRTPLDDPLIANYGGYYRLPLGKPETAQDEVDSRRGAFGYNEITHQFSLPPPTGRPDLTFFANRSTTDTGVQRGPSGYLAYQTATNSSGEIYHPLSISTNSAGQNITLNEGLGLKLNLPVPEWGGIRSSFSMGGDFKRYLATSYNTNENFFLIQYYDSHGNLVIDKADAPQPLTTTESAVQYYPINIGYNGSRPDRWGNTSLNVQANYNLTTIGSLPQLAYSAGTPQNQARDNYYTVQAGMTREQRLYKDWTALVHADGQWASCPLFSNEQYGMGGSSGVRGYMDGEVYGDTGWKMSFEPRTPMINIGMVDGDIPFWLRASVFMDYGETYLLQKTSPTSSDSEKFWGYGGSLTANIGNHLDGRLTIAFPLISSALTRAESVHVYFGVGAQF